MPLDAVIGGCVLKFVPSLLPGIRIEEKGLGQCLIGIALTQGIPEGIGINVSEEYVINGFVRIIAHSARRVQVETFVVEVFIGR